MGSKIPPHLRKHAPHQHLKAEHEEVLSRFLPIQMTQVRDGWVFKEGWSIRRVAVALGTPYTAHNVSTYVKKHFAAPTPVEPAPDTSGGVVADDKFLDEIKTMITAIGLDVAEIKAKVFGGVNTKLDQHSKALNYLMLVASGKKPAETNADPKITP